MSAVYLALLLPALLAAVAMGVAVLLMLRGLRRQIAALHGEWPSSMAIPAARKGDAEAALRRRGEIREAVAQALAEERERELAEARAFWAAQEAREAADASVLDIRTEDTGDGPVYAGYEEWRPAPLSAEASGRFDQQFTDALREAIDELVRDTEAGTTADDRTDRTDRTDDEAAVENEVGIEVGPDDSADPGDAPRAAVPDMRRHPSHPDFHPSPAVADQVRTTDRLKALAANGTPLRDIRPAPLGTLDIYVFGDGTTLCVTPGDRAATQRITDALRSGESTVLLGGSAIGGAFALTFGAVGETVYVLADRVVASF